jgi:adenylylsulfate kinase-like enzyme
LTADGGAPDPARAGASLAADALCDRIDSLRGFAAAPVLVALDGRSAAGKSTLAQQVAVRTGALVIDGDDFYHGATTPSGMRAARRRRSISSSTGAAGSLL